MNFKRYIKFVFVFSLFILCMLAGFVLLKKYSANNLVEAQKYLLSASTRLDQIKYTIPSTSEDVISTLEQYSNDISQALTFAKKVNNPDESEKILTRIFNTTATQLGDIEIIQNRPPLGKNSGDFGTVDRIKDENISVQEDAVESINARASTANETLTESNTITELQCPDCNLIFISLTTLRKDHMSIYGYKKKTSPAIDNFFGQSLIFTNTMAPTSWTAPNAVSLFTSLFPYRHGIIGRDPFPIYNRKILTMAELLKSNGYQTAAFTGGGDYNNRYSGLNRGFDYYLDETNYNELGIRGDIPLGSVTLLYAPLHSFLSYGTQWMEKQYKNKFFPDASGL